MYPSLLPPPAVSTSAAAMVKHMARNPIWRIGTYGEVALNILWPLGLEYWSTFLGEIICLDLDAHIRALDYLAEKNRQGQWPRYVYVFNTGHVGL